jgi:hypothetical protein
MLVSGMVSLYIRNHKRYVGMANCQPYGVQLVAHIVSIMVSRV